MDVGEYIRSEVKRQGSTKFLEFASALDYAIGYRMGTDERSEGRPFDQVVMRIAFRVEPDINRLYRPPVAGSNLRRSHVGFLDGGSACPTAEVPGRFERLMATGWPDLGDVDVWCKQLLEIHPWADGNGRVASLLRNLFLGTLDDPTPLPFYFGQSDRGPTPETG